MATRQPSQQIAVARQSPSLALLSIQPRRSSCQSRSYHYRLRAQMRMEHQEHLRALYSPKLDRLPAWAKAMAMEQVAVLLHQQSKLRIAFPPHLAPLLRARTVAAQATTTIQAMATCPQGLTVETLPVQAQITEVLPTVLTRTQMDTGIRT